MEEPLVLELHSLALRSAYNETKNIFARCAMMGFISYNCLHISELLPHQHTHISSLDCKSALSQTYFVMGT